MQNCKIEQDQPGLQQANPTPTAQTIQVMPTVLGTAGGQQILLQSLQPTMGGGGQQQFQVVPIQSLGQSGAIIVQPQVQAQPQIVQLPDGQTFIYQPMIPETPAQPQIVNINGNFYQIPAQPATPAQTQPTTTIQNQQTTGTTQNQPTNQQVIMMTAGNSQTVNAAAPQQNEPTIAAQTSVTNLIASASVSPPPNTSSPAPQAESEEEPLYVNASKLKLKCLDIFK